MIEEFKKKGWGNPDNCEKEGSMDNTLKYYNKNGIIQKLAARRKRRYDYEFEMRIVFRWGWRNR